jgi:hypothetical protein
MEVTLLGIVQGLGVAIDKFFESHVTRLDLETKPLN